MGFLCSLLLLASCHSDDNEPTLMDDEPQTVTISINLADAYTRTVNENEDSELRYLWMQVIDNGTKGRVEELTLSDNTATTSLKLYPSHSYTFLFWADDGTYDSATDLTNVAYDAQGTKAGLAYAARVDWNGEATINANLTHVTSKVTLKTTTKVWAGNQLTLTIPSSDLYRGYNVLEGVPAGQSPEDYTYDYTPETDITATEDNPVELFSFYVLAADETQDITISCNEQSITVPVNLSGGKHITLTGDVGGMTEEIPTSSPLDVSLGAWDDFTFELDNLLTDATVASASLQGTGTKDDPYLINNPADFKCYMNDVTYRNGKYALLNTDIQIITDNWTPMDVFFGATFDGGGHTISGEIKYEESMAVDGGVFGSVTSECTICNLNVSANISVTATGTATSYIYAGGIAAMLSQKGAITGCTYSGTLTVTGTSQGNIAIGGIAGTSNGTISGCTFSGKIDATGASATLSKFIGGIAGENHGTLDDTNKDEGTVYQ